MPLVSCRRPINHTFVFVFVYLFTCILFQESWEQSNLNQDIESLREELLREFDEQKEVEFEESLEEAKAIWLEELDEQKQAEINDAIAFLEAQYKNSLEEFKHKELREALTQAREQWAKEEEAEWEETHKVQRLTFSNWWKSAQLRIWLG